MRIEKGRELCSALLRCDGGEGCDELVHALASTVRTGDFGFLDVGDVVLLSEFLVAVLAVIKVLGHSSTPANMIAPFVVDARVGGTES
jgi:hypothetical protein